MCFDFHIDSEKQQDRCSVMLQLYFLLCLATSLVWYRYNGIRKQISVFNILFDNLLVRP